MDESEELEEEGVSESESEDDDVEAHPGVRAEGIYEGGKLVGVSVSNQYTHNPVIIRKYRSYMLKADPPLPYFVGYVRKLAKPKKNRSYKAEVVWHYRVTDMLAEGELNEAAEAMLSRPAQVGEAKKGGRGKAAKDGGKYKEVLMSDHADVVLCDAFVHEVKVWYLPDDKLDPVVLPASAPGLPGVLEPGGAGGPGGSGSGAHMAASCALVPGFVCRKFYLRSADPREVLQLGKAAGSEGVGLQSRQDAKVLLQQTRDELPPYKQQWLSTCASRVQQQQQQQQQPHR